MNILVFNCPSGSWKVMLLTGKCERFNFCLSLYHGTGDPGFKRT